MKDEEVIEEDFDLCEDFDYYTKTVKRKDGKIEVIFEIDAKTEKGRKILKKNPKFIKESILKTMPLSMRLKFKLGMHPKIKEYRG